MTETLDVLIRFSGGDLERLEHINELLVDGYAGEAGVALGHFLDELQQRMVESIDTSQMRPAREVDPRLPPPRTAP